MQTFSLVNKPPQYIALSYCWGDENVTQDIIVNGCRKAVTVNLAEALRQLSDRTYREVMVWAGALCINQQDSQERSQ